MKISKKKRWNFTIQDLVIARDGTAVKVRVTTKKTEPIIIVHLWAKTTASQQPNTLFALFCNRNLYDLETNVNRKLTGNKYKLTELSHSNLQ